MDGALLFFHGPLYSVVVDWYTFLILTHIVGTVLGVGGATFAEVNLIRALRDGQVSPDESELMRGTYAVLRLGFFLLVLSGFGFLLYYRLHGLEELLYSAKLWAKLSIIGILAANAILLQTRTIPLLWGSALSITSWYAALTLGVLRGMDYAYFGVLAWYALAVVATYFVLREIHRRFIPPSRV